MFVTFITSSDVTAVNFIHPFFGWIELIFRILKLIFVFILKFVNIFNTCL